MPSTNYGHDPAKIMDESEYAEYIKTNPYCRPYPGLKKEE